MALNLNGKFDSCQKLLLSLNASQPVASDVPCIHHERPECHRCNQTEHPMATVTIPNVDGALEAQLRLRAALNGVSMQEEDRRTLRDALAPASNPEPPMVQHLLGCFAGVASTDFMPPQRQPTRTQPPRGDAAEHHRFVRVHATTTRCASGGHTQHSGL